MHVRRQHPQTVISFHFLIFYLAQIRNFASGNSLREMSNKLLYNQINFFVKGDRTKIQILLEEQG